jgi:hypothetical protein
LADRVVEGAIVLADGDIECNGAADNEAFIIGVRSELRYVVNTLFDDHVVFELLEALWSAVAVAAVLAAVLAAVVARVEGALL